jgi:hypothetical protein
VNRLPESDFVVVLEKGGRVVEQGTFSDLRSGGGYIQNLDISSHDENDSQPSTDAKPTEENDKAEVKSQVQDEPVEIPSDRSVFMYYFKSNGLHNMALQAFFIASGGVITAFRCKSKSKRVKKENN